MTVSEPPIDRKSSSVQSNFLPSTQKKLPFSKQSNPSIRDSLDIHSWSHVYNVDQLLDFVVKMDPASLHIFKMKMYAGEKPGPEDHKYRDFLASFQKVTSLPDELPEPDMWRGESAWQLTSMSAQGKSFNH